LGGVGALRAAAVAMMSGARAFHTVAAGGPVVGCRLVRLVRWLSRAEMMLLMASTLSWGCCRG
jgi:hypothetical protein